MIDRTTADLLRELIDRPAGLTPDLVPPAGLAPLVAAGLAAPMLCNDENGVPSARLCATLEGMRQLERWRSRWILLAGRLAPGLTALATLIAALSSCMLATANLRQLREQVRANPSHDGEAQRQPPGVRADEPRDRIDGRERVENAAETVGEVAEVGNTIPDLPRERETILERQPAMAPAVLRATEENRETEQRPAEEQTASEAGGR